jgi:hypothetical protein
LFLGKPSRGDYAADEALYTVEAKSYEPNIIYIMAGNVSEWTDSLMILMLMNISYNEPKRFRCI